MKPPGVVLAAVGVLVLGLLLGVSLTQRAASTDAPDLPRQAFVTLQASVVRELPAETPPADIQVHQDVSVFDLRFWHPAPAAAPSPEPAMYVNFLRLRKKREASEFVAHYSTSGERIDFGCVTHECRIELQDPAHSEHPGQREYAVRFDVSKTRVEEDVLLIVQATYWGGFRDQTAESASTYADSDVDQLSDLRLIILLPKDKPFRGFSMLTRAESTPDWQRYGRTSDMSTDPTKQFLHWRITDVRPGHHYGLEWTW